MNFLEDLSIGLFDFALTESPISVGNPDKLEGGEINFTKRHLTYKFMDVVRRSQTTPYNIAPRDDLITFFNNFSDFMEEEEMWQRSEAIKPRRRRG